MSTHVSVLCVGDGAPVQDATTRLEREDDSITVETEAKAADALAAVEERQPDCVVSGYALPEADGVELLSSVREVAPGLPFVLIADTIPEADAQRAISLDVTDYFCTDVGAAREELLTERVVSAARRDGEIAASHRSTEQLEREYETVFENVQEALFLLDVDEEDDIRFQRINQREADAIGKSTAAVRGKTPVEVFGEELGAELEANYRECLEKQASITYEEELVFDEEPTVWQTTLTPIVIDGAVERIVGATREITGLKRTQEELERKNDLFEQAQEIADLGAWETDLRTGEGWWTKEVNEIYGLEPDYQPEAGEGIEYYHPEDRPEVREAFERAVEKGESYDIEARIGDAEETRRWARLRGQPRMEDGDVVAVRGTIQDITERKQREQELRYYERIIEAFSDIATVIGPDGTIQYVSPSVRAVLGYEPDELIGEEGFGYQPQEDTDRVAAAIDEVLEDPSTVRTVETRFRRADGSWCWIEATIQNRLDDDVIDGLLVNSRDITERKERERELEATKDRLDMALDASRLGVYDWDVADESITFDDRVAELLGYDPEEFDHDLSAWAELTHPEDLPRVESDIEAMLNGDRTSARSEYRVRTKNGDWRWIRSHGRVVEWTGDGEPARIVGVHQDITERKEREQRLQQFREAVEQTGHAVYITDRDGTIGYVNPAFEELTGYSEAEALGETPNILSSGEYDESFYETFWEALENGERWEAEMIDQRADGEEIVLHQTISPLVDGDEPQKYVAIAQDVTDRKEYEEALKTAREELRQVIDLVPDLVFVKNRDGEYLLANEATADAYGMSPDELEGKKESDVIPEVEDSEQFRKDDIEVIESGEPKEVPEEKLTTADGETRILETTKIPYQSAETSDDAVLGYARDITELKEYEQTLERQRDDLEVLNQVVRHDIRNDLQLVLAYADLLEDHVDEEGEEFIRQVLEAARDAVNITTTARDVTEVLLQSTDDPRPVNLRRVLEEQAEDIRSSHERALVTVEGPLPSCRVLADGMLESVFRNLLSNAIQHNDKALPEVALSATADDDTVVVRIADNGPGIPDDRKEQIFEEGEKGLDSEGTGLGLYLVDTLVDRYGGEVRVEDNDPDGSVFVVELQRAE